MKLNHNAQPQELIHALEWSTSFSEFRLFIEFIFKTLHKTEISSETVTAIEGLTWLLNQTQTPLPNPRSPEALLEQATRLLKKDICADVARLYYADHQPALSIAHTLSISLRTTRRLIRQTINKLTLEFWWARNYPSPQIRKGRTTRDTLPLTLEDVDFVAIIRDIERQQQPTPAATAATKTFEHQLKTVYKLTPREIELAKILVRTSGTWAKEQEIADELVVTPDTIKSHRRNLYKKLGLPKGRRAQICDELRAIKAGTTQPSDNTRLSQKGEPS